MRIFKLDRASKPALLLVANWDSNVGYAWWLMESFWDALARAYHPEFRVFLAYPSISVIPDITRAAPAITVELDFTSRTLRSRWDQMAFVFKNKVQTIYYTDQSSIDPFYVALHLSGVRTIAVHDHTPGERTRPDRIRGLLKRVLQRISPIRADILIAATRFVHDRHLNVVCASPDRCFIAPNGLPARAAAPALDIRQEFCIRPEAIVVATVSRAHQYKGIDFAIRLIAECNRLGFGMELHYLFCGDGPHLDKFKALALALGVSGQVTFAGRRSDVRSILASCDVAIHPSRGEVGYSLSILEYMEASLPVLVPDNPSVAEATIHGQTGYLYRPDDIEDAARHLRMLAGSRDLRCRLGANARDLVARKFSLAEAHRGLLAAMARVDEGFPVQP